ncbi:hypothetical protein BHM03_00011945 [Ensete ventricosum]|uniref:Uncharacterized protein n=1 Tax=Ensete ventricosum TaxID=4639 RepID=A0A445MDL1_ENSVE|nr:hypothetical protein BHM03_00011945 [Ensete ventricosum]
MGSTDVAASGWRQRLRRRAKQRLADEVAGDSGGQSMGSDKRQQGWLAAMKKEGNSSVRCDRGQRQREYDRCNDDVDVGGDDDDVKGSDYGITVEMPRIVALIPIDRTLGCSIVEGEGEKGR